MSRGHGWLQRDILKWLDINGEGGLFMVSAYDIARDVYKLGLGHKPTRAQMSAINRAMHGLKGELEKRGWELGKRDIRQRDDIWCRNQRRATGLVTELKHKESWRNFLRETGDKRRDAENVKVDAMGDNERVAYLHDRAAAETLGSERSEIMQLVLMDLMDMLKKCPIELADVPMVKRAILDAHIKHRLRVSANAETKVDEANQRIAACM